LGPAVAIAPELLGCGAVEEHPTTNAAIAIAMAIFTYHPVA
jgi:hypothetical protein